MKRAFSNAEPASAVVVRSVVNPHEHSRMPQDDPNQDYRLAGQASAAGHTFRNVKLPFGSARVPFIYHANDRGYVNGYPYPPTKLPRWPLVPAMLCHLDNQYANRTPPLKDSDWSFSAAALFMDAEAWDHFIEVGYDSLLYQHVELVTNYNAAVAQYNRDALASVYYHLSSVMRRLFGIAYRTLATLDLRELFPYLRRLYTEGGSVALEPVNIALWPTLTHRAFRAPRSQTEPEPEPEPDAEAEEEVVNIDPDDDDDFFKDYDTDTGVDGNVALDHHDDHLFETLVLKGIPKPSSDNPKLPRGVNKRLVWGGFLPLAARADREKGIDPATAYGATLLPLPSFGQVNEMEWIVYAVEQIVRREFTRNGHYFVTPPMLEVQLRVFDERYVKGIFPIRIDRRKLPEAITKLIEKNTLVVARGDEIAKECADLAHSAASPMHIHLRMAWKQEKQIIEGIQKMVDKGRATAEDITDDHIPAEVTLSDEQKTAVKLAVTQTFSMITGPGGSGKSTVLKTIHKILRARLGPSAQFLYCSFRNGIVYRLLTTIAKLEGGAMRPKVEDIDKDSKDAPFEPNLFRTLDSILHEVIRYNSGHILTPAVVVMEEAGQSRGAHFQALIRAISLDRIRHFILIGDANQLSPIGQGAPFMHMLKIHPENAIKLNRVYRTEEKELRSRQDAILDGKYAPVLLPCDDDDSEAFKWIPMDDRRGRMFVDTMVSYAGQLFGTLRRIDPARGSYDKIMGLCPYNDYATLGSVVMIMYYFDSKASSEMAAKDLVARRRPMVMSIFHMGARVVFEENKKKEEVPGEGLYSRGQVGKIVAILSSTSTAFPLPRMLENAVGLKREKKTDEIKENGAVYIELLDTGLLVRLECGRAGRGLSSKISHGSFMTANRSQGLEFDYVICMCPWGMNIADRSVIYTMATRPTKSLTLIAPKTHLCKMIETPPEPKMTQMTALYAYKRRQDTDEDDD